MDQLMPAGSFPSLQRNARQPIRSGVGGGALIVFGPVAAILLFFLFIGFVANFQWRLVGGIFLFGGAAYAVDAGRRMRTLDGWVLMQRDPRAPVIFLRPFQEDERLIYDSPVGHREGGQSISPSGSRKATREPKLAPVLNGIGPFIAVGRPGELLTQLGAARIYVSDDEWRETVSALVRRASAVVLQPEATNGTIWELDLVGRAVDRRRLLLLVPGQTLRPLGYMRIRALTAQLLPATVPLPEMCRECDAFMFDGDGRPVPISFKPDLRSALRPFIEQVRSLDVRREEMK